MHSRQKGKAMIDNQSAVVWADAARVLARFFLRCKADYAHAVGEDQEEFTPGKIRVETPRGDIEEFPATPSEIWTRGDAGELYDDGETPDAFLEGWANSTDFEAALVEAVPGAENRGDVLTMEEADDWLTRFADKITLTIERQLRGVKTYRSWQGFQRFKRCVAKNTEKANAEMLGAWLRDREVTGPRKLSSRLRPGYKRSRVPGVPEADLQTPKRSKEPSWGSGSTWIRLGHAAWGWPAGRPPLPKGAWLARYRARRKAQRKTSRPYRMVKRKRLKAPPEPQRLRPRPDAREWRHRREMAGKSA